ncbi:hypothetical protein RGUI_0921 [Rhodovulum sp. P5]|uniref:Hint domain-containing protein n=1 Tax=Rhodovulum sp. P5 TaxID=1564506 RepID=UPI0009C314E5|nr:Hint domain-containing protein [Rhodovulum sp. P5]ARE39062.1 hypothetical protein RGUI_0921 [Rhodovulum sp. P5]
MDFRINFEGCEPVFPQWGPTTGTPDRKAKPMMASLASGFAAGTEIATPDGPRPVETLTVGDPVLTFDNGPQPVRAIQRGVLWRGEVPCPLPLWPLEVPAGALGNATPLTLLPEQSILIESDVAEMLYGSPFVLMPARLMVGLMGIARRAPTDVVEVVMPLFDEPQIAFANGSALVFCRAEAEACSAMPDDADLDVPTVAGYSAPEPRIARVVAQALRITQTDDAVHAA